MSVVAATLATPADPSAVPAERCESVRCVLFFDGVCGLCNKSVDFVLAHEPRHEIQFAPLQGDTARQLLTPRDQQNLDTMVFWVAGTTYRKSAATVRVLWRLNTPWPILGTLLWLIPLPIRNLGYSIVARNRYRFFGKKESCRLPTAEERPRFLP